MTTLLINATFIIVSLNNPTGGWSLVARSLAQPLITLPRPGVSFYPGPARRSLPWNIPIASTQAECLESAEYHSNNFQNEQVENGGGHVYRSVKRARCKQKFREHKSDPDEHVHAHMLEKRFLFRRRCREPR